MESGQITLNLERLNRKAIETEASKRVNTPPIMKMVPVKMHAVMKNGKANGILTQFNEEA